jgi:hypothetical protein
MLSIPLWTILWVVVSLALLVMLGFGLLTSRKLQTIVRIAVVGGMMSLTPFESLLSGLQSRKRTWRSSELVRSGSV